MKVRIRQMGGFAGLIRDLGSRDTARMDARAAKALESAVRALESGGGPEEIGADLPVFEVRIEEAGESRAFTVRDSGPPESKPLRDLLDLFDGQ